MKNPKVEFVYDINGKALGVIISKKEYEKILDIIDDYHDYKIAKSFEGKKIGKTYSSEDISQILNYE